MDSPEEEPQPSDTQLAAALAALANPVRLALLRQLRRPHVLTEIRVRAVETSRGPGPADRTLARQSVREHLGKLLEIGAVEARDVKRESGPAVEYILNHQTLFSLAEEFRGLARLRPTAELGAQTLRGPPAAEAPLPAGPCLVLVHGLEEGKTYALTPPASGTRTWSIGRRRGVAVSLDFDPYVSAEHSAVVWADGAHWLEDIPENRNGTLLNFRPMPRGGRHHLATGDLVGVGRSILMFRGAPL
jgi:DNA-binding transcriptional ArsR family regulator